jgi:hypothetical protein
VHIPTTHPPSSPPSLHTNKKKKDHFITAAAVIHSHPAMAFFNFKASIFFMGALFLLAVSDEKEEKGRLACLGG